MSFISCILWLRPKYPAQSLLRTPNPPTGSPTVSGISLRLQPRCTHLHPLRPSACSTSSSPRVTETTKRAPRRWPPGRFLYPTSFSETEPAGYANIKIIKGGRSNQLVVHQFSIGLSELGRWACAWAGSCGLRAQENRIFYFSIRDFCNREQDTEETVTSTTILQGSNW
jgi:hypothetical protein